MDASVIRRFVCLLALPAATTLLGACAATPPLGATRNQIIISVRDQKLTVVKEDHSRETFPISTSKFGLGDRSRSYETPTGRLAVAAKIGGGSTPGTVFHGRIKTGEIVKVDAPGRDAIVTRILALRGLESNNSKAFSRGIYIHGTPEERNIGRPTSYGCIRMRSSDVIKLYDMVRVGATVQIIDSTMNSAVATNIIAPDRPAQVTAPASVPVPADGTQVASTEGATKTIVTSGNNATGATTTTTTTSTAPVAAPEARKLTVTTTTQPPPGADAKPAAASGKKEWAGAPTKLLAKQTAAEARAKSAATRPPVGAPATSPVSNNDSNASSTLHRSMFDSL